MYTYKYLPKERISFLQDGLLRFTPPADLNDPFECSPIISVEQTHEVARKYIAYKEEQLRASGTTMKQRDAFRKVKRRILADLTNNPALLRDFFFARADAKQNSQIGILSLSKRWDSAVMWAHYSVSHSGFCVGFDRQHAFFQGLPKDPGTRIREVAYASRRVQVPLERGENIDIDVMFTKSVDWRYEEEERLLRLFVDAKAVIAKEPYPIHLFEIPLAAVTEVIVGARASDATKAAVMGFCSARDIAVFRAEPSSETFDMTRSSLS